MEVHHHSHAHGKKNWKSYFWEFLMLFLAVFCGFLAEYQLEQIIEEHRAKEFAVSMAKDLSEDTAQLSRFALIMNIATNNSDSFLTLVSQNDPQKIPSGTLYYYGLFGGSPHIFTPTDATIQQMKSSGTLRYFKNKSLNQNVAKYDQLLRIMKSEQDHDVNLFTEVRRSRSKIFLTRYNTDANNVYQSYMKSGNPAVIDSFVKTTPPVLSYDKTLFNEYAELIRSRFLRKKVSMADSLYKQAIVLLTELKTEYHLE